MKPQTEIPTKPGENHTGITLNPQGAREMIEGTAEFGPTSRGTAELIAQNRIRVAKESDPAATMPASPGVDLDMIPMLDKLGARLQFERTGVRLYDALVSKLDAYGTFPDGPSREDLLKIRGEELRHFEMVHALIEKMGGDPTVVTPCANLQATASRGVCDVLVDPRTTLIECLDAILVAELADHASWEMLASMAQLVNQPALMSALREGERTEAEHLVKVRGWLAAAAKLAAKTTH
jgi:rubrerythrin